VPRYDTYADFRSNPRSGNGRKLGLEELEPTKFQSSWISGYAKETGLPAIGSLFRKADAGLDKQWSSSVLFGRTQGWLNLLAQIPVASDPDRLREHVISMNEYFYPSHPIGHYPYL
jgi:hypothetical protein